MQVLGINEPCYFMCQGLRFCSVMAATRDPPPMPEDCSFILWCNLHIQGSQTIPPCTLLGCENQRGCFQKQQNKQEIVSAGTSTALPQMEKRQTKFSWAYKNE